LTARAVVWKTPTSAMTLATCHVFFDLDGTLTDPAPGIVACFQYLLRKLGTGQAVSDGSLRRFIGPPLRPAIAELLGTADPERIEQGVAIYRERFATEGLYENSVYPGVPAMLEELCADGSQLWVVTSKAEVYAAEITRHFGLSGYLQGVYGAELTGERSVKAELIAHLLEREGIAPRGSVMIGDRRHDIDGANAHGLPALGVLWGYGSREELQAAGAHALIEAVSGLPAAIRALPWGRDVGLR
jgi:phosphoglycolate phosphatase